MTDEMILRLARVIYMHEACVPLSDPSPELLEDARRGLDYVLTGRDRFDWEWEEGSPEATKR